jgi:hypothetical protein
MLTDVNKYVQGKKNAFTTKTARKLWVQDKLRQYKLEEEELRVELISDAKVIEALEDLKKEHDELTEALNRAKLRMADLNGQDVDVAIDALLKAKADVEEVEAKMRLKYYAK